MKKLILMAVTALSITAATAQTNTATPGNTGSNNGSTGTTGSMGTTNTGTQPDGSIQTPSLITNHFNVDYAGNNATWYQDGSNYRGEYIDSKTNMSKVAIYDKNGVRIGTEEQLSNGSYPATISDYYTKMYPNETDYQVWSSNDGMGNTTYYTTRKSETIWFDKTGKYKSKTKNKSYKTQNKK